MQVRPAVMEIKAVSDEGDFEGYLSVFGDTDSYGDVVQKGAFSKSLQEKGARRPMLWQHDTTQPIGVLDAKEDAKGLWIVGHINQEVQRGREAKALIKQGSVRGLSQGFMINRYESLKDGGRLLTEIDLWEGSPVTFPALPSAQIVSHRSLLPPTLQRRVDQDLEDAAETRAALRLLSGMAAKRGG